MFKLDCNLINTKKELVNLEIRKTRPQWKKESNNFYITSCFQLWEFITHSLRIPPKIGKVQKHCIPPTGIAHL